MPTQAGVVGGNATWPYVPIWHGQARPHLASYMVVAPRYLYFRKLYYRVISARSIRAFGVQCRNRCGLAAGFVHTPVSGIYSNPTHRPPIYGPRHTWTTRTRQHAHAPNQAQQHPTAPRSRRGSALNSLAYSDAPGSRSLTNHRAPHRTPAVQASERVWVCACVGERVPSCPLSCPYVH